MLSDKEKAILEFLFQNKDKIVTSKEIADKLKLSDRTIRSYIKILQKTLLQNGAEIIAKQGLGYVVRVNNEHKFNTFLQKNDNNLIEKNKLQCDNSKGRQNHILNKLLFEDAYVLFDDLCDELFVCRSTLSNDFTEIRKFLKSYNLSVISKVKKGVYIQGDERDKRHFIIDYFFGKDFCISINKYVGNTLFFNDISLEEITIIVLDECRGAGFKLSDYIIQNLVLHIALLIKRIKDGFEISMGDTDKYIENSEELLVAKRILNRITLANNIEFPKEEAYYIALHLKVKSISKNTGEIEKFDNKKKVYDELISILANIEYNTKYLIKNDQQLINGLMVHFHSLRMRLEHSVTLENPLLGEIKEKYGDVFKLTKHYLSSMSILKDYKVSDSEWAYICLHFMAAIERFKDKNKLNVLVICATGYGSGQMLSIRLKKELGNQVNIVDVIGYYEITDEKLKGIDLIISSIDLYTVVFNIPVIHVSVFLDSNEINEIKSFIDKKIVSQFKRDNEGSCNLSSEKRMLFNKFFKDDCFLILDKSDSKENIIESLVNLLQKYESSEYSNIMIKQIAQREHMSSVVFSENIAVPHPAKSIGENAHVAVAIIKEGIQWNDECTDIKFIFLLSPSKIENTNLKEVTRAIVSLTEDDYIQKKLLKCRDFKEFEDTFIELI